MQTYPPEANHLINATCRLTGTLKDRLLILSFAAISRLSKDSDRAIKSAMNPISNERMGDGFLSLHIAWQ